MPFHWSPEPIIAQFGSIELRWYGVCFAIGILLGATKLPRIYARRGFSEDDANSLSIWIPVCMIIGAHLVHIVFYDTHLLTRLWDNPWSKENWGPIWDVRSGLASHGGGLGCILAVWGYSRAKGKNFFELVDATMLAAVWVFPWVRIGNFMNSEIYGRPTDVPWAVVFDSVSPLPRHPTQLYEAALGFLLIAVSVWLDRKQARRLRPGALFLILLGLYFFWRFLVEFFKEYQTLDGAQAALTMGQWLSLPIFSLCALVLLLSKRHGLRSPPDPDQRWWERLEADALAGAGGADGGAQDEAE